MNKIKDKYLQKAREAIQDVFKYDYPLLTLPFPEIDFLSEEDENYQSGMYYISVGDNWQIHLNFGKLPDDYKAFQEEVKVLTRHEIEHYRTCPHNVLTHFRMIKTVLNTINANQNQKLRYPGQVAGDIANQIADVIIDTKNYKKHSRKTLKSEIEWIKKGGKGAFKDSPRHNKLMFLLKQTLWNEDLMLNETDEKLLETVKKLADKFTGANDTEKKIFKNHCIENTSALLNITESYTELFQHLFELDLIDFNKKQKAGAGDSDKNSLDSDNPQEMSDGQSSSVPDKNGSDPAENLLFQNSEQVDDAINQLALETTLEEFNTILESAGIKQLSDNDKKRIWFEQQNVDAIPLEEKISKGSKNDMSYPAPWRLGESVEELDMLLTLQVFPKIIPGITTKKWEKHLNENPLDEKNEADLLLVIDRSASMGKLSDNHSNLHITVLAAFGFVKHFEQKKSDIALISFSDTALLHDWTKQYEQIKNALLYDCAGGTCFPQSQIKELLQKKLVNTVIVIITDGEIENWVSTLNLFRKLLSMGNKIFLFIINNPCITKKYMSLRKYGGFVENASCVDDIRDTVLRKI